MSATVLSASESVDDNNDCPDLVRLDHIRTCPLAVHTPRRRKAFFDLNYKLLRSCCTQGIVESRKDIVAPSKTTYTLGQMGDYFAK